MAKAKAAPKKEELVTVKGHKDIRVGQLIADTHEDYGCEMYYDAMDLVFEEFGFTPGSLLTTDMIKAVCEFLMKNNTEYLGEFTSIMENYYPTVIEFSTEYITQQTIQGLCPYCGDGTMMFYGDRVGSDEVLENGIIFNCSECDTEMRVSIDKYTITPN